MPTVLVAANADHILQVCGGPPAAAGHLICQDAAFLYTVAGPGRPRDPRAMDWLRAALHAPAAKGRPFREVLAGLAEAASGFLRAGTDGLDVPPADPRLTIMFSGYTADDFIVNAFVSNFQNIETSVDLAAARDRFEVHVERSISRTNGNPAVIHLVGAPGGLGPADGDDLRALLLRRSPAALLRQKALAIVEGILARQAGEGSAPPVLAIARLDHADPWAAAAGDPAEPVDGYGGRFDRIDLRAAAGAAGAAFAAQGATPPPPVHRNALCPCGSGRRYRDCHRPAEVRGSPKA